MQTCGVTESKIKLKRFSATGFWFFWLAWWVVACDTTITVVNTVPTPTPSHTTAPAPTRTPALTATVAPTSTAVLTATAVPTMTITPPVTATTTVTPTIAATATVTATRTPAATPTRTIAPTAAPTITVACTLPDLIVLVNLQFTLNQFSNRGSYQSSLEKLLQAQRDLRGEDDDKDKKDDKKDKDKKDKDKSNKAVERLRDFIQHVSKESGKQITVNATVILTKSAECVIKSLNAN